MDNILNFSTVVCPKDPNSAFILVICNDSASNEVSINTFGAIDTDQQILDEGRSQSAFLISTVLNNQSIDSPVTDRYDNPAYKKTISFTREKNNNINLLMRFGELKDGWDGEHAIALNESLINKVINIVIELNYQPEIFPTTYGTIQMEYEKEDGSYLEIEVTNVDNIKVFSIDKSGQEKTDYIKAASQEINEVVDSFYG